MSQTLFIEVWSVRNLVVFTVHDNDFLTSPCMQPDSPILNALDIKDAQVDQNQTHCHFHNLRCFSTSFDSMVCRSAYDLKRLQGRSFPQINRHFILRTGRLLALLICTLLLLPLPFEGGFSYTFERATLV